MPKWIVTVQFTQSKEITVYAKDESEAEEKAVDIVLKWNGIDDAPVRIQRKRTKGWRMPDNTVVVDRSTGFGNPFPVEKGTSTTMGKTSDIWAVGTFEGPAMWFKETKSEAASLSVQAFRAWITQPAQANLLDRARLHLRGKNLACWCPLCERHKDGKPFDEVCADCPPCHGDVLGELANA